MSNTSNTSPTKAQRRPFERLEAALQAVGFTTESGGEHFNLWLEARVPDACGHAQINNEGHRAYGQHALHFSFDARSGKLDSYAITQDVWEQTDQDTVVDVNCTKSRPKTHPKLTVPRHLQ